MKTAVVGGMILGVHCVVIGSVVLMGGCGRTASVAGPEQLPPSESTPRAVMPPEEPVLTPPRVVPMPGDLAAVKPAAPAGDLQKYVIKRGDMLSSIAVRHGVSAKELAKINNITNPNKIKVGQTLLLPAGAKAKAVVQKSTQKAVVAGEGMQVYTVAKNDCLSKIAARFGTTTKDLMAKNELSSDKVRVGQKLVVPAKEKAQAAVAPAADAAAPVLAEPAVVPAAATEPSASVPSTPAAAVEEPGATAPAAVPGADAAGFTHDVVAGETIQDIAYKYGVSVEKLMSFNNLTSREIQPPLTLKIPQVN
ncbi:MAG: LysM peptidoglycan-binding domain-containing protein [bacterium]